MTNPPFWLGSCSGAAGLPRAPQCGADGGGPAAPGGSSSHEKGVLGAEFCSRCVLPPLFSPICTQFCPAHRESVAHWPVGPSLRWSAHYPPPSHPETRPCALSQRLVTERPPVSALQTAPSVIEATATRARRVPRTKRQYPRTSRGALCLRANRRTEHPRNRIRPRRPRPSSSRDRRPSRQSRRSVG